MMKAEKVRSYIVIAAMLAVIPIAVRSAEPRATRGEEQSSKTSTANAQKGKIVFENLGCNKCHGSEGEGVAGPGQRGGVPRIASTSLALPGFHVNRRNTSRPAADSAFRLRQLRARTNRPDAALRREGGFQRGSRRNL